MHIGSSTSQIFHISQLTKSIHYYVSTVSCERQVQAALTTVSLTEDPLRTATLFLSSYIRSWRGQVKCHCVTCKDEMAYRPVFCSTLPRKYASQTNTFCVPHYVLSGYICVLCCKVLHFVTVLGAFAKLRKANISFFMSVCQSVRPSVRIEQFGSHWTDFHEVTYLSIFLKPVEKFKVSLKSDGNNGYFK